MVEVVEVGVLSLIADCFPVALPHWMNGPALLKGGNV